MDSNTLYRLYDADGKLLYVGQSTRWTSRMKEHARHKEWWGEVAEVKLEQFNTLSEVTQAEREAIVNERPKYNLQHNQKPAVVRDVELEQLCLHLQQRLVTAKQQIDCDQIVIRQIRDCLDKNVMAVERLSWVIVNLVSELNETERLMNLRRDHFYGLIEKAEQRAKAAEQRAEGAEARLLQEIGLGTRMLEHARWCMRRISEYDPLSAR